MISKFLAWGTGRVSCYYYNVETRKNTLEVSQEGFFLFRQHNFGRLTKHLNVDVE